MDTDMNEHGQSDIGIIQSRDNHGNILSSVPAVLATYIYIS